MLYPRNKIKYFVFLAILMMASFCFSASAYVASSTNYRLEKDSLNVGGLDNSTSTNYILLDTIGELGTGTSTSANYGIKAGYRQMDEVYLSISGPGSIALSPNLGGVTGGVADGEGTWNVKTDAATGYGLNLKATSTPALASATHTISDYTPAVPGTPDFAWDLNGANSEFGFSPYNTASQVDKFKNNGSNCNIGSNITDGDCWYNFSTSNEEIANRTSRTEVAGEDTEINFQAEIGGIQAEGTYTATVVVTAVSN